MTVLNVGLGYTSLDVGYGCFSNHVAGVGDTTGSGFEAC